MISNDNEQVKIEFNHDWLCRATVESSSDIYTNEDYTWKSIELPHIIWKKDDESDTNIDNVEQNWWYRKEFQWKNRRTNFNQKISLLFEPIQNDNDDHLIIEYLTIWLNKIQIYFNTYQSSKIEIDLTEYLLYRDEFNENIETNLLLIYCKNSSLHLRSSLLVPLDQEHAVSIAAEPSHDLPQRKNPVLDHMIGFNPCEGRFDLLFNSNLKYPILSQLVVPSKIITTDNNQDRLQTKSSEKKENAEEYRIPRLAIVMLIVGTRGDVQPFIAFGQTLVSAGHRVRLATHEKFRQVVREHGLEFYPIASNPEDLMTFMVKNGGVFPSISSIMQGDLEKKRRDISNILLSTWHACTFDDDETRAPFTAEVIIANPPSFGHVHCAQKLQIPLHMMFTMPWSATIAFPHAFCNVDYARMSKEKMNLFSYRIMDAFTWSGIRDLVNEFRQKILNLPPLHTRQAISLLIDEKVPHTYCWSPSLVAAPSDWPSYINVSGYFFLDNDIDRYQPTDDLIHFLDLNNSEKRSPPIYIGFGSIVGNDSHQLFQIVIETLKKTDYRALLFGFDDEDIELSDQFLKIGDTPHDWLFQYVSAVCHHGGAGSVAASLRAGKPTIVVPFFGDQFFWGNMVAKSGAGPEPIPGKHLTVERLAQAFRQVHEQEMIDAAQRIRHALLSENGCLNALRLFHIQLPLGRMRSDLESTFPARYRVEQFDLQVSKPVAQVLIAAGSLDESQFENHPTRIWSSIYDHRARVPTSGVFKHTGKAFSHIFIHSAKDMKHATSNENVFIGTASGLGHAAQNVGKGIAHLPVGILSLYGEFTDVLNRIPTLYDKSNDSNHEEFPPVVDFKSGVQAAGYSLGHGWKEGLTGFVKKPRVGYHRNGILGGATGAAIATANGIVKPLAGSLASVTWVGRGVYADIINNKNRSKRKSKQINTIIDQIAVPRTSLSTTRTPSTSTSDDDDDDVPQCIQFAAIVSGYSTKICRQILDEFEKVKKYHETNSLSSNQTHRHQHKRFQRFRRHSDSAL